MDRGQVTLLALFDVSAAFDSVDHSILLQRLSISFGLAGAPLEWLRSFLSERTNCVVVGASRSRWVPAPFGVPQGSVLGPLLYILYTAGISSLLSTCGLLHQLYADDVQAYVHCLAADVMSSVSLMSHAIDALSSWMASNRLLLNPSKTQFIWLGTRRQLASIDLRLLAVTFLISLSLSQFETSESLSIKQARKRDLNSRGGNFTDHWQNPAHWGHRSIEVPVYKKGKRRQLPFRASIQLRLWIKSSISHSILIRSLVVATTSFVNSELSHDPSLIMLL